MELRLVHFLISSASPQSCGESRARKPLEENKVVKVSPGGSLPGGEGCEGHVILGFRVPTTSESKKFDDNR